MDTPATPAAPVDDDLRKRLLAINVLLEMPEDLSDELEVELYGLRDRLQGVLLRM